jgi:hypothetical protein
VTVDSNDSGVSSRIALYKQQHVALGVAYGPGAVSYVDLSNQIVEFDLRSEHAVRPSMPFDDSKDESYVWYNFSHKEAKVYSPSTKLGSLAKGRYLPVKFTNSDVRDVLSFDSYTGKASLKLTLTIDDADEIPR